MISIPKSARALIVSPNATAPNSKALIGSRNVTSSRFVAPTVARIRK